MPRKGPAPPSARSWSIRSTARRWFPSWSARSCSTARRPWPRTSSTAPSSTRAKTGVDPVQTLKRALDNIKPQLEVKSRRVGGATYQVPIEVKPARATTLSMRWLVTFARQRREKTMVERLMNEILDASNGLGAAVKRREDTHKMAEANRAFAHYRW